MNKFNFEYNQNNNNVVVLFLHGWGLKGDSFDNIINHLQEVSYIKLDLLGFGKSLDPKEYFDVYEYAYQIFLLLKKLNINKIIIVGHSFGGRLGIVLSSIFKINVLGLVLTSSAGLNRFSLVKWIKIRIYKICKYFVKKKFLSDKILRKFGSRDLKNGNKIMQRILKNVVVQDLSFLLKNIFCKTYLVWDKRDKDTPYWICKKLNKNIKSSSIITCKNGGHFVAFKNPYKFSKLINNLYKTVQY